MPTFGTSRSFTSIGAFIILLICQVAAGLSLSERATALLQDFQVYPPVLTPNQAGAVLTNGSGSYMAQAPLASEGCIETQTLMVHTFANSYGAPFVGQYTPPKCAFNRVTFNVTVISAGRQYDRLALVYFGNTELWRTSTAEPTSTGIIWTYIKDMSNYLALFKEPQKLIFDLGNLINDVDTAPYHATLTATFFTSEDTVTPADQIIPISARLASQNMPSAWEYPSQNASNTVALPQNIRKAFFTISATGQIDEEFWFGNVLQSEVNTFGVGFLYGYSPFREVQLYIDGSLAGVAWPFPIIFTGGVVPGLWRPIVGIDAFDLREDEIDITPWLPLLCNGKTHTFEIRVASINDNGKNQGELTNNVGSYWVLTGKIFLWLDTPESKTTGSQISRYEPSPSIQLSSHITKTSNGTNDTLTYSVDVKRNFVISSTVETSEGQSKAVWSQSLSYTNNGDFTNEGNVQATTQSSNGIHLSTTGYARRFDYPVFVNTTYDFYTSENFTIAAVLTRGQEIDIAGSPVFPTGLQSFGPLPEAHSKYPSFQGSRLYTTQNGTAFYTSVTPSGGSESFGTTQQDMTFAGIRFDSSSNRSSFPSAQGSEEFYQRHVVAVNATVTEDNETLFGQPFMSFTRGSSKGGPNDYAPASIKKTVGRGPGNSQVDL